MIRVTMPGTMPGTVGAAQGTVGAAQKQGRSKIARRTTEDHLKPVPLRPRSVLRILTGK